MDERLISLKEAAALSGLSRSYSRLQFHLDGDVAERVTALENLLGIDEFRAMKMQPSLERALRHKGVLHA